MPGFDDGVRSDDAPDADVTTWRAGRIAVRCTPEWAEWLGGLSVHCDAPAAQIVAQAVYRFAEAVGYNRRPPVRVRGSGVCGRAAHLRYDLEGRGRGTQDG